MVLSTSDGIFVQESS